ncbi:MAG: hypothetical protein KKD48_04340 [Nanoarchaeota archaeon]|nr:hypothetical protein [Nanoarchaeota archaeon]
MNLEDISQKVKYFVAGIVTSSLIFFSFNHYLSQKVNENTDIAMHIECSSNESVEGLIKTYCNRNESFIMNAPLDDKLVVNCAQDVPIDLKREKYFDPGDIRCSQDIYKNLTYPSSNVCYDLYHTNEPLLINQEITTIHIEKCYDYNGFYTLKSINEELERCYDYNEESGDYESLEIDQIINDIHSQKTYQNKLIYKDYSNVTFKCNGG